MNICPDPRGLWSAENKANHWQMWLCVSDWLEYTNQTLAIGPFTPERYDVPPWPPFPLVDYHLFQTISISSSISGSLPRLHLDIIKQIAYIRTQHTHGQHPTRYSICHQALRKTTLKRDVCFYILG
jgi:hypothetical protein